MISTLHYIYIAMVMMISYKRLDAIAKGCWSVGALVSKTHKQRVFFIGKQ